MNITISRANLFSLLLAATTILFLIVVQAHHFYERPYRQDEAWVVHYALARFERVGVVAHVFSPLLSLVPENVLQDIWVYFFGHHEHVVRHLSGLVTAITLALFYRLAADLYERHTGWLAIVLLGTYSVFSYYSHEARPYALLACGAVGFTWALLRFLRQPNFKRGAFAVLVATVTSYTHPYIVFVIVAQLICILVFVRWNRELYRRGMLLFAVMAVLIGYRAYINYSAREGVIRYNVESSWQGLLTLYDYFRASPESLGLLLVLGGLATFFTKLLYAWRVRGSGGSSVASPVPTRVWLDTRMRHPTLWREGWLLLSALMMLAIPLAVNVLTPSLTPRNLLILAPMLVLIAAVALRQMPRHLQLLVVFFFCLPFVSEFRSFGGNAGYWELSTYIEDRYDRGRDRLVVVTAQLWESVPINYFLQERARIGLTGNDIFYISADTFVNDPFIPPKFNEALTATSYGEDDEMRLGVFLAEGERLWLIKGNPYAGGDRLIDAIEAEFSLYRMVDFPGETYYRPLEVLEYRRRPAANEALLGFGADINLLSWRLNDAHIVQPCDQISVDTWWSTEVALDQLFSTTLTLAGVDGNGLANADDMPGGMFLTSMWQPGEKYFDERSLTIPCDIAEGDYSLLLGMYEIPRDDQPLKALSIYTSAGAPTGRTYEYLTTLQVRR